MSPTADGQAPAASVTWEQALAWRMGRQFLGGTGANSVPDVVDRLCGVQAQVASAADLAVRVRLAAPHPHAVPDPGAVPSAVATGEVFKTWAMRGTLHLLTPESGRNVLALMASGKSWERPSWQRYFGMTPRDMERLREAIYAVLENGPMTREELIVAITARPGLGHAAEQLASGWGTLLKPAAWHGLLAFGPSRGTRVTFMRTDQAARGWRGLPSAEEAAPLAIRAYLGAYGPSTPETFSTWLAGGYFGRKQLRGWFAELGDELAVIDIDGERQYLLREHLDELASTQPSGIVRLVPGFDQAVLGPTTRDVHVAGSGAPQRGQPDGGLDRAGRARGRTSRRNVGSPRRSAGDRLVAGAGCATEKKAGCGSGAHRHAAGSAASSRRTAGGIACPT